MADFDGVFDEVADSMLQSVLRGGINQLFEASVKIDVTKVNETLDEDPEQESLVSPYQIRGKGRESNFTTNLIEQMQIEMEESADCDSIFEYFKRKMFAVDGSDGKVMKRIVRDGYGERVAGQARITFDYIGYVETDSEPFDSTLTHRRPYSLVLGRDSIIYGLELGLGSMKVGETAQFLIDYEYAYGKYGVPDQIEAETDVFFEVHLYSFKDPSEIDQLYVSYEDRNKYSYVLNIVQKLQAEAFTHLTINSEVALHKYLKAARLLENCSMADYDEEKQRNSLLIKILTDIAVCSNKLSQPKRACWACNRIYRLVPHFAQTSAQVLYQNAKALVELDDHKTAYKRIAFAAHKLPHDSDIQQQKFLIECLLKSKNESIDCLSLDFENMTFVETEEECVEDQLPALIQADLKANCLRIANDETLTEIRVEFLESLTTDKFMLAVDFVEKFNLRLTKKNDAVFLEKIF